MSKKKHNVRKPEVEADPEFQIAPMIDILLVLLVFFMSISTTEVLQANQNIDLPVAKDAKEPPKDSQAGQVIVNISYAAINNATKIDVQDQEYTETQLTDLITQKVARNPLTKVVIRADKQVRYQFLRQVLAAIGNAGASSVTFSVVDKEVPK